MAIAKAPALPAGRERSCPVRVTGGRRDHLLERLDERTDLDAAAVPDANAKPVEVL